MPDNRKCPLCESECTYERTERGIERDSVRCKNEGCRLSLSLWDTVGSLRKQRNEAEAEVVTLRGVVVQLQRERDEAAAAVTTLTDLVAQLKVEQHRQ